MFSGNTQTGAHSVYLANCWSVSGDTHTHTGYIWPTAGLFQATGTGGFAGTLTELLGAAEDELYSDYPTENVAEDDECREHC